jgi:hypothetical protein
MMRTVSLLVLTVAVTLVGQTAGAFSVSTTARSFSRRRSSRIVSSRVALQATPEDGGGNGSNQEDKLTQLGYSRDDIERSRKESDKEELIVNVNLLPDIDPLTLTAIGFGLIAFNFFVLANSGDGGIAGVVASIINLSNS